MATQMWEHQPDLTDYRWYPTMVPLPNGGLLATGGGGLRNPERVTTSETFDPATMTWTPAGEVAVGNEVSPAVLLYTGEVLMTHRPPQLYNPTTRRWRMAADFVQGNRMPNGDHSDHEITLMPNGEVVAVGYKSFTGTPGAVVEVYDPIREAWRIGAPHAPARSRASTILLPNRKILVLGGEKEDPVDTTRTNPWGYMWLTEAYDAEIDSWHRLADLKVAREYHTLPILVPDGRVLVVGGEEAPGREPSRSVVEAFSPPYLFRGVRPRLAPLDSTRYRRGERLTLCVDRTAAPTEVILMGTTATTHFMDSGNGRYLSLPFTQENQTLTATLPTEPARLPFGFYLLMVLVDDIPSSAHIIRIDAGDEVVVGISEPPEAPLPQLELQAFPSPFTDRTTITFVISQRIAVRLRVYDAVGRAVATLVDDRLPPGKYTLNWKPQEQAAGLYHVHITTGTASQTRPVVYVK